MSNKDVKIHHVANKKQLEITVKKVSEKDLEKSAKN